MTHNNRGNILFLILLAIILFAALSAAVVNSTRVSEDSKLTRDKASLNAARIMNYAGTVENTINRLRLVNGCAPEQISLQNDFTTPNYANGSAPAKCRLFGSDGGKLAWETPPDRFPPAGGNDYWHNHYSYWGSNDFAGVGTSAADLVLMARVTPETCQAIQDKLGYDAILNSNTWDDPYFSGAYTGSPTTDSTYTAVSAYCFRYAAFNMYFYRHVVLAR